ncbi:hypothetical protein BZA77DRAFT_320189 [Pyronema omphalodes]|nr:hypothetical protein BZA77DRAFT_320189 [Pyronema omphalodes]
MLQLLLALSNPHSSTTLFALAPLSCTALTALCSLCGCNQPFYSVSSISNSVSLTDFGCRVPSFLCGNLKNQLSYLRLQRNKVNKFIMTKFTNTSYRFNPL